MLRVGYDAQTFLCANGGLGKGLHYETCSAGTLKPLPASHPRRPITPA